MQYICTFLSKRNVPLVLKHLPEPDKTLLTIENWESWEETSLYLACHDGSSGCILDDKFLHQQYWALVELYKKDNTPTYENGVFNPVFVIDLADEMGYDIDETSLDVIFGRWQRKIEG